MADEAQAFPPIPPDDSRRRLAVARPNGPAPLRHVGIAGNTYTILLSGEDTAGRFCLMDMHVPPGGGPRPTATTSRRRSPSSAARSSSPSAAKGSCSGPARR